MLSVRAVLSLSGRRDRVVALFVSLLADPVFHARRADAAAGCAGGRPVTAARQRAEA